MASTFSPSLRIELIGDGEQSGIWGQTTNTNLGTLIEQAIAGVVSITMADANYTLSNFNGVSDESRNQVLVVSGTNGAVRNIIAPLVEKTYVVKNSTTGGFGVQIIGSSGTGVTIPNGITTTVYCDGTNFYSANNGTVDNFTVNGIITGNGSGISAINAANIASGTVATARLAPTGTANSTTFLRGDQTWAAPVVNASAITTGTLAVANGGTGLTSTPSNGQLDIGNGSGFTRATLTPGSGIGITNGSGTITITNTQPVTGGTVTSVATGNGLSGGTITSTGTLVVACPGFNTVGSYAFVSGYGDNGGTLTAGSNYNAGSGVPNLAIQLGVLIGQGGTLGYDNSNSLSGTWKWMNKTTTISASLGYGIACRVT